MLSILKRLLPMTAAFGLVFGAMTLSAKAEDAAAGKGSISGTVTDKDGKAIEGVTVNLMKPRQHGGGGGGGAPAEKPADKASLGHDALQLQNRPAPIATATTDKDGKFEMKDVAVGNYMVGVRDTDKKAFGRAQVKVEDGKTATVEIKCTDTPPARGGGNGGGGGAAPKQ